MRRNTFPPRPRPDDGRLLRTQPDRAPEQPKRKIFNCIVDDTALIAGAKKSTRDGIRKWISQDAIRLFVPLHTLSQLNRLKKGDERINIDSRDALKWLDDITSMPSIDDRVQLEGVEEAYSTWDEVEQFLLPETLLSMEESDSEEDEDDDDYAEDLESSFNALDVSDETSMSSTHSLDQSPKVSHTSRDSVRSSIPEHDSTDQKLPKRTILSSASPDRTARNSNEIPRSGKMPRNHVPVYLRPLFNHILWRIHKESNPDAALESFILLTNDPNKQTIAQKFGIRAKRLEQLRDAVAREDREYKNHLVMYKMESEARKDAAPTTTEKVPDHRPKSSHSSVGKLSTVDSDDEDEVILKRAPRGPANPTANQRVFDPNDFGRAPARGNRAGFNGTRGGRGGPPRGPSNRGGGRGGFNPRGGAYVAPGPAFRQPATPRHDPNQPIDPDSFARPSPRGNAVRGARRSLWEPI